MSFSNCRPNSVTFYLTDTVSVGGSAALAGSASLLFNETFAVSGPSKYLIECPTSSNTYLPSTVYVASAKASFSETATLTGPYSKTKRNTATLAQQSPPGTVTEAEVSTLTLGPLPHTSITCSPSTQLVGRTVNCEVDVFGSAPTGTVTLSASSDSVFLRESSCQLSPDPYVTASSCQIQLGSTTQGTFSVTAQYSGDPSNPSSAASASVSFVEPAPEAGLSLSCDPSVGNQTLHASCTARVYGASTQATGSVAWNATNPVGILSASTCALVNGSCGVTYFQANASEATTITAAYTGDAYHLPKEASDTIIVMGAGVGTLDQRQTTGFVIRVSGTPGTMVNASSTYYYAQPNGTGTAPFASNEYFDLKVYGAVNGYVEVCHLGANVNASTSLDYYSGGWNSATNVVVTAGQSVCGDIPASALTGTSLDVGGTSSPVTTSTTTTGSLTSLFTTSPTLTSSSWTSVGPFGVPGGLAAPELGLGAYPNRGIGNDTVSGSVRAVGASPDLSVIYTGGSEALGVTGIWASTNGGRTWAYAGLGHLFVISILVDPTNPSTVLANGIANCNLAECAGVVVKSTDGGHSWSPTYQGGGGFLYLAPNSTVYATTQDRVLKSNDFGSTWTSVGVVQGTIEAAAFVDNGAVVYLGGSFGAGSGGEPPPPSLLRLSGGKSATLYSDPQFGSFETVVVNPSNTNEIWAAVGQQSGGQLLNSSNGGATWENATISGVGSLQCMALDPGMQDTLLLGFDGVLVTFGGAGGGQVLLVGPDVRYIGSTNGELMVGSDQGLFISADGGGTWQALNDRPNFLVNSVAAGGSAVVFSAQDYNNAFTTSNGGRTWGTLDGGCLSDLSICTQTKETGWVIADPYNSSFVVMVGSPFTPNGNMLLVSDDGGLTFQPSMVTYTFVYSFPQPGESYLNATTMRPSDSSVQPSVLAFAPDGNSAVMVACPSGPFVPLTCGGVQGPMTYLFRTQDGGRTWSEVAPAPGAFAVGIGGQNPGYLYFMNATSLYVSKDGGSTFSATGHLPLDSLSASIAVDPTNSANMAVAIPDCCLALSSDGGNTFEQVPVTNSTGSNLMNQHPKLYTYLLPSGRVVLVLLTDSALQVSFDFGRTWTPMGRGLPPTTLESFSLSSSGDGYVSTWGYGIWEWQNLAGALESAPLTGTIAVGQSSGSAGLFTSVYDLATIVALVVVAVSVPVALARRRRRRRATT